jgi:hypothetical protein
VTAWVTLACLLLYSVGRPIFTDDLWWHLALGRAYLAEGPWLAADPLLFSAQGPPTPASWLFDAASYGLLDLGGLTLLRIFHVAWVAGLLAFAWRSFRRSGATRAVAGLATSAFIVLAAYRLFQLRPELATILATLALYALLFSSERVPSYGRVALATLLCALWANLHAGFLLGPILLAGALLGIVITLPLQPTRRRSSQILRTRRLGLALGLAIAASLLNPQGPDAYLAYFAAGDSTPDLSVVGDEWTPLHLFSLPRSNSPPAPVVWGIFWLLLPAVALTALRALHSWRDDDESRWVDPALLALAAAGWVAGLLAVRFSWLACFALLLLARTSRHAPRPAITSSVAAAGSLLLVPGYLVLGDWPFLSQGVPRDLAGYAVPYPAHKYYANAAWFLQDAGVEGRLFTAYDQGGFYGFWLAPRVRPFVNGSLNVPQATLDDYLAIQTGHGLTSRSEMLERLAAHDIDLFLGTGLPSAPRPNRPWRYTTSHLEEAPGWLLVYRNLQSALYLRVSADNHEQIARIDRYYESNGVPIDPIAGLDVGAISRQAPAWAIREGLVPPRFPELLAERYAVQPGRRIPAQNRLANLHAGLGLYERAVAIDRGLVRGSAPPPESRRRLVWSLLHLGRDEEALAAAAGLSGDGLSGYIAATAQRIASIDDPEVRALSLAFLPLFTHAESGRIASGRVPTPARLFDTSMQERGALRKPATAPEAVGCPAPTLAPAVSAKSRPRRLERTHQ